MKQNLLSTQPAVLGTFHLSLSLRLNLNPPPMNRVPGVIRRSKYFEAIPLLLRPEHSLLTTCFPDLVSTDSAPAAGSLIGMEWLLLVAWVGSSW